MHQCRLFHSSQFLFVFKLNFKAIQSDWKLSGQQTNEHLRKGQSLQSCLSFESISFWIVRQWAVFEWIKHSKILFSCAWERAKRRERKIQKSNSSDPFALFPRPLAAFQLSEMKFKMKFHFVHYSRLFFLFFSEPSDNFSHQTKPTYNFQSSPSPSPLTSTMSEWNSDSLRWEKKVLNFI